MYAKDLIGQYVIRTEIAPLGNRTATNTPVVLIDIRGNDVIVGYYRCHEHTRDDEKIYKTGTIKNANDDHWMPFNDLMIRIQPKAAAYYAAEHPWIGKTVISKSSPNAPKKILAVTPSHVLYSETKKRHVFKVYQPVRIWHHSEVPADLILYEDVLSLITEESKQLMKPFNPLIDTLQHICKAGTDIIQCEEEHILAMTPDFVIVVDTGFENDIYIYNRNEQDIYQDHSVQF